MRIAKVICTINELKYNSGDFLKRKITNKNISQEYNRLCGCPEKTISN